MNNKKNRKVSARDKKKDYWKGVIEEWNTSGKPIAIFCREKNIPKTTFYYWHYKLQDKPIKKKEPSFAPVKIIDNGPITSNPGIRIECPNGFNIYLQNKFDSETLIKLLNLMGVNSC